MRDLRGLSPPVLAAVALLGAAALVLRVRNALRYPPDWGFDATFNWKYIFELGRSWRLPDPTTSWATSDPPLFFYLGGALLRALTALGARDAVLWALPLLNTAAGLAMVALAAALVARVAPGDTRRTLLAAGLLLYLPAHVQMSVMVNEEIWAALFTSLAVVGLAARGAEPFAARRAAGVGLAAGLAWLSKLTGALAALCATASYALEGLRTGALRAGARAAAVCALAACLAGGWYFARNQLRYGYLQPHGLPAHQGMFELPPGERGPGDYLRVPLATFTDPQLLHPQLLRSVWGSTYVTTWFDGHRYFLPVESAGVRRLGAVTLLLALLPSGAAALGLLRGARRALREPRGPDAPQLLLVALTLAGYALFTWRNPWYAVVKGTSLLGLGVPFAFYGSEVLADWTRRRGAAAAAVWAALAALAVCVLAGTSFDLFFERPEVSGLPWRESATP